MRWLAPLFLAFIIFQSGCLSFFENPITTEAVEKGDPEICKKIERDYEMEKCFRKVAVSEGDYRICETYFSKGDNVNLLDECYGRVGAKTNELSTCNKISENSGKMQCYSSVGKNTNDVSICEKIKGEPNYKNGCFQKVAVSLDDPYICTQIDEVSVYHRECYTKIAVKRSDSDLCGQIGHEGVEDICLQKVADKTGYVKDCEKMHGQDNKGFCLGKLTGDYSHCENIKIGMLKQSCLMHSSVKGDDVRACEQIENKGRKEGCIKNIAKNTGDPKLCDKLDERNRPTCQYGAAVEANDSQKCKLQKETYRHTSCVKEIAVKTADLDMCDEITQSRLKDECKKEVFKEKEKRKEQEEGFADKVQDFVGSLLESNNKTQDKDDGGSFGMEIFSYLGF